MNVHIDTWPGHPQYWDIRQPNAVSSVMLPERCYALSVTSPLMTVATAERHLLVYDLNKPTTVFKVG